MVDSELKTIDDVISRLEEIIQESKKTNSTCGYFASLYQKVTIKVKEGIDCEFFEDGKRMEQLDIIFAKRYLDAYSAWQRKEEVAESWKIAFEKSDEYWPIVLQHLLLGMNAHINLDLGIAAAEVAKNQNIKDLENDFNKINELLASLVNDVQDRLANIWPLLRKILKMASSVDDFLVDFSMELARDGAWKFATEIAGKTKTELTEPIQKRDLKVANKAQIITKPGFTANLIFKVIRLRERGSVSEKIKKLLH